MTHSLANGRYTLDVRIAAGGMGEVWRGTDTSLGREVAIKLLRPDVAEDETFRTRFAAEAQHAASLHDPHIATVFDYGDDFDETTGRHATYLVMELVDGVPLSQLVTQPMAPAQAALLVAQAADGLAAAHAAGIVHRDVKPANFLVTPDGRVKVTDFGIARAKGAASITDTGTIMGTPHYVAPEVAEGREATPASDLYSLGVVLYEALSGVKPFTGATPVAVALSHLRDEPRPLPGSVPAQLRAIVESTMAKDPAQRPPDAAALAGALRAFATRPDAQVVDASTTPSATQTQVLPVVAAAPVPVSRIHDDGPPPGQTRRRVGWLPVAAAVVAVLLVVGIAYAVSSGGGGGDSAGQDKSATTRTQGNQPARSADKTTAPQTTSAPSTQSTGPAEITINPDDYVGREFKDVEKALKDLGLEVSRQDVGGGEKDIVAGLAPTGTVQDGQQVTVSVYTGSDNAPGHSGEHHHGKPKED